MNFIDKLLTKDPRSEPYELSGYELYVLPDNQPPQFERLRTLQQPGQRQNKQLVMDCVGGKKTGLEVHASEAGLPFIIPAVDPATGKPSSLKTIDIKPFADLEAVLYDYIEGWKTRGDVAVLKNIFGFDRIPSCDRPHLLGDDFEFNPSSWTLQRVKQGKEHWYRSIVEKVALSEEFDTYATFHVMHDVSVLGEIMGFTLRYWLHDGKHHLTFENQNKRPVHGEFSLYHRTRGGDLFYSGCAGYVDVRSNCKYTPWANFDQEGNLLDVRKSTHLKANDGHIYRCDFNNTLKELVDIMVGFDNWQIAKLAKLSYVKWR